MSLRVIPYRGYTITLYLHHATISFGGEVVNTVFTYWGAKNWIDQELDEVN